MFNGRKDNVIYFYFCTYFENMGSSPKKTPPPLISLIPVLVLVGLLYAAVRAFGGNVLEGASQVVLLTATAVCALLSIVFYRVRWKDIEKAIVNNITGVASALLILLLIGALSGTWMVSGIIPTLIYYGMKVIHPDFYLASACVICAVVSVMTGSSWTTVATMGVALSGIGLAQGFSPGWIGGAIISGAYFGDKVSPLSDTTVLASAVTDTPLFMHIRYMMITTVPSILIALLTYTVAGLSYHTASTGEIAAYSESLNNTFHISPWLLLVPVAMGFLIAKRVPPLITLFLACLMACLCALLFQSPVLSEISGAGTSGLQAQFRGTLTAVYGSTSIDTGHAALNELVSTRGMAGMMHTIWLIVCAMCFGGAMTAAGMLGSIISVFLRFMKNTVGIVSSTVFSGLFFNACTGDQYLSIILTGDMYKDIYRRKGYESRLLSRSTEDGVTVTSPLVPWNTCGMTQATVLGIPTLTYAPYAFFNLVSPLMSLLVAAAGYKIKRMVSNEHSHKT
jgi:NhaC family Na+:H+ antiporter